jgi:hypothetical protein
MISALTYKIRGCESGRYARASLQGVVLALVFATVLHPELRAETPGQLNMQISVGHTSVAFKQFMIRLVTEGGVTLNGQSSWQTSAGGGRAEDHTFKIAYPVAEVKPQQDMHVIWADLIAHSDADTANRLLQDPALRTDERRIRFELNADGTRGFTLTIDQLLQSRQFWIPSHDLYISIGSPPVPFAENQKQLEQYRGNRVIDEVHRQPEATYEEFKRRWQDMGNPSYVHPEQRGPGHIVGLTWDSTVAKFGIDRGAGVWNDYGNPDHFRFWFGFGNIAEGITPYWKSQTLQDGLPVMTTTFERDRVRYEVEQFAYPLYGPPSERSGNIPMALLQRVKMTELTGRSRTIPVSLVHERALKSGPDTTVSAKSDKGHWIWQTNEDGKTLLAVTPEGAKIAWSGIRENDQKPKRLDITLSVSLPASETREFLVTLPSPVVFSADLAALRALDYDHARAATLAFWSSYLAQGASFNVPEKAVNDLFRANLWHALRLPRRSSDQQIDLPYSNFAYDQTGTPWPINQAVYVDYMIYGLRGYNEIASDEIAAIYRNNQQADGHVDGFAHWLAYTPGMLYAVAENYLVSGDRAAFDKSLPETLKALDWTLRLTHSASQTHGPTAGLVEGPLNDITGTGYWLFNQAYLYAGLDLFAKALQKAGNPRAEECRIAAAQFRKDLIHAVELSTVASPLVELRDHTWIPYTPSNAARPGRNYEQWYPSDVDTGPLHLPRLNALPSDGDLADAMLNDHEDNLFLHAWGLANEPVYDQQGTAYLQRDDAKAAIRTFYSMMAGGFSHGVYEPVEHRWRWGQYFGPPSTDGAWFELYRNMLLRELDSDTLLIGQATPRAWLEDGKQIKVDNAPTQAGKVSFEIDSSAATGKIHATVRIDQCRSGEQILLRLRHPEGKPLRTVNVNGQKWKDFNVKQEWIRIPQASSEPYSIDAAY